VKLKIKVVPGASSDSVEWFEEESLLLKVRVTAAPEKGKANKAVKKLLAEKLDLPKASVIITSGQTSQLKLIELTGLTVQELHDKLG
jgi:uncharacterized protein (TIGR00251 family)